MDLTNMGTIYSKGSYEVNTATHYLKRYKYGGNVSLSYGSHNYGLAGRPASAKDFHITGRTAKTQMQTPAATFSASVNAGTSGFYQNNPATVNYNLNTLTQTLCDQALIIVKHGRVRHST